MSLNIKNEHVVQLVNQAAQLAGTNKTRAIELALTEYIKNHQTTKNINADIAWFEGIEAIIDEFQSTGITRADYEAAMEELYDEDGLPQ